MDVLTSGTFGEAPQVVRRGCLWSSCSSLKHPLKFLYSVLSKCWSLTQFEFNFKLNYLFYWAGTVLFTITVSCTMFYTVFSHGFTWMYTHWSMAFSYQARLSWRGHPTKTYLSLWWRCSFWRIKVQESTSLLKSLVLDSPALLTDRKGSKGWWNGSLAFMVFHWGWQWDPSARVTAVHTPGLSFSPSYSTLFHHAFPGGIITEGVKNLNYHFFESLPYV